ncbi:Aryl-alcohol dehydrogenase family enzyme [Lentilactobacillus senioris DSM 24302 = JCM 17472]|uniref:Aryl-alcohol dehydrogenase family enzyme n=1 Tax=Lentilactobacillus senioris DSM 24302 = JCM 17472 TaxID=1423802 RepID=A0A0R2CPW4_9LACO|nr:aldo/keto reductase [Lentilactobacillus senioris]KRM93274.1 Aryl-alcohol dehydrogenase family enzyme [Lentilactobacillus senioris DSM 24302 = JCM 17472]
MYIANDNRYDQMPIRRAGNSGFQLPALSLGLWRNYGNHADIANSEATMLTAFDNGIFHFDLANNYGPDAGTAEETFGQIMTKDLRPYRHELVLSTKAGFSMWPGPYGEMSSRKTLITSLDESLKRMQVDYVDIFYSHRPDPVTSFEETAEALADIVRSGKALYIGISNYNTEQTKQMATLLRERNVPFVVNQYSYNLLNQEAVTTGLLDELKQDNAGMVAYGPLAEGLLSGKYNTGIPSDFPIHRTNKFLFANGTDQVVTKLNQLTELANNRGQTLAQMAIAWLLHDPVVTSIILGVSNQDHLISNLEALNHLEFTTDELAKINEIVNQ